jgi:hypothetical protein
MRQYRNLRVSVVVDDPVARVSRPVTYTVQLRKYFMMNWAEGTEERRDYDTVTRGSRDDVWFQANKERIRTAAMGKGAPQDYELALEWAVRSRRIPNVTQASLQTYCDDHLGIDCSGFVTNYLVACGKRTYSSNLVRNTGAASYFNRANAVNDPTQVRQGDLLVWMDGNSVKTNPGHVAVVESYTAQSVAGGNMRVVEATGASGANPKLLDSMYAVEQIIPRGGAVPVMILVVRRHGVSGSRVAVMRVS